MSAQQRLWHGRVQQRVDKIAEAIPAEAWQRIRVAEGAKGPRVYDWAAGRYGTRTERSLVRWLLIRRGINKPAERAYYLCTALPESTLSDLAMAAGQRWSIESCFKTAKQETGLDDYEVRSWHGWYRHVTLSMAAMALLTVIRLAADDALSKKKRTHLPKNDSLLAHSAPEATGLDARDCCPNTVPI